MNKLSAQNNTIYNYDQSFFPFTRVSTWTYGMTTSLILREVTLELTCWRNLEWSIMQRERETSTVFIKLVKKEKTKDINGAREKRKKMGVKIRKKRRKCNYEHTLMIIRIE